MLLTAIKENFDELSGLVRQLSNEEFTRPCSELNGSTIGEHIRHILEMYTCLEKAYISGVVEYDKRERDLLLQTRCEVALETIAVLSSRLDKPNKPMKLKFILEGQELMIPSNFERELLYNLEHSIHHQALIKVGLRQMGAVVNENFGVARSTIAYRSSQCVQ